MKNLTISVEEDLHRATRIEAAKAGKSMSRYVADVLEATIKAGKSVDEAEERNPQLEALERFLAGPKWDVTENGRMPNAEERNARR